MPILISPLTFYNDGFPIRKGSQDVKADPPRSGWTLCLGSVELAWSGTKRYICKSRIRFCLSSSFSHPRP